ncbi:hypothetical protein DNTS_030562, partial [Danionella cerebrum]
RNKSDSLPTQSRKSLETQRKCVSVSLLLLLEQNLLHIRPETDLKKSRVCLREMDESEPYIEAQEYLEKIIQMNFIQDQELCQNQGSNSKNEQHNTDHTDSHGKDIQHHNPDIHQELDLDPDKEGQVLSLDTRQQVNINCEKHDLDLNRDQPVFDPSQKNNEINLIQVQMDMDQNQDKQDLGLNQYKQDLGLNQDKQDLHVNQGNKKQELNQDKQDLGLNQNKQELHLNQDKQDLDLNLDKQDRVLNQDKQELHVNQGNQKQELNQDKQDLGLNQDKQNLDLNQNKKDQDLNQDKQKLHLNQDNQQLHLNQDNQELHLNQDKQDLDQNLDKQELDLNQDKQELDLNQDKQERHLNQDKQELHLNQDKQELDLNQDKQELDLNQDKQELHLNQDKQELDLDQHKLELDLNKDKQELDLNQRKLELEIIQGKQELDLNQEKQQFHLNPDRRVLNLNQDKQELDLNQRKLELDIIQGKQELDLNQEKQELDLNQDKQELDLNQDEQELHLNQDKQELDLDQHKLELDLNKDKQELDLNQRKLELDIIQGKQEQDLNQEKQELDLNQDKQELDLNQRKLELDIIQDKQEPHLNQDKQELDLNQEKQELNLNQDKQELDLNQNKQELELNQDKQELDLIQEKQQLDLNQDRQVLNLNQDKQELYVKQNQQELDLNQDKQELDLNQDKQELDLNQDKQELDLNQEKQQLDLNQDRQVLNLNQNKEELDVNQNKQELGVNEDKWVLDLNHGKWELVLNKGYRELDLNQDKNELDPIQENHELSQNEEKQELDLNQDTQGTNLALKKMVTDFNQDKQDQELKVMPDQENIANIKQELKVLDQELQKHDNLDSGLHVHSKDSDRGLPLQKEDPLPSIPLDTVDSDIGIPLVPVTGPCSPLSFASVPWESLQTKPELSIVGCDSVHVNQRQDRSLDLGSSDLVLVSDLDLHSSDLLSSENRSSPSQNKKSSRSQEEKKHKETFNQREESCLTMDQSQNIVITQRTEPNEAMVAGLERPNREPEETSNDEKSKINQSLDSLCDANQALDHSENKERVKSPAVPKHNCKLENGLVPVNQRFMDVSGGESSEHIQSSSLQTTSPEEDLPPQTELPIGSVFSKPRQDQDQTPGTPQKEETLVPCFNGTHDPVNRTEARQLAEKLHRLDGFQRTDVVRHLDKDNEFSCAVGEEYLSFFDFSSQTLEQALRSFLKEVVIIGETQERERVLQFFSSRFQQCNPKAFSSAGSVLALTCAVMLLNTDLHGQNVGKPMSSADFVLNLDGMNGGQNFSKELLKSLYSSIKSEPLEWAVKEEVLAQSLMPEVDGYLDRSLRSKSNPFQDLPHDTKATVFHRGFLNCKSQADIDGKRTPWGKRRWKAFYATLKGMVLYLQKDDYVKDCKSSEEVISVHHALAEREVKYTKRPHVFRLQTADWRVFLLQAPSQDQMESWIGRINLVSALFSSAPFPAADKQLQSHGAMLRSFQEDLDSIQKGVPEIQKPRGRELEEQRQREQYLLYEKCRYEVYLHVLEVWWKLDAHKTSVLDVAQVQDSSVSEALALFDETLRKDTLDPQMELTAAGLKRSLSSPSLEPQGPVTATIVKVRRNISERRTCRKILVPRQKL